MGMDWGELSKLLVWNYNLYESPVYFGYQGPDRILENPIKGFSLRNQVPNKQKEEKWNTKSMLGLTLAKMR
jgi:hypothetical protein